jgi:hypothetical protein
MTPAQPALDALMEGDDLAERATGRAAFLRDRGEVKTPDLLEPSPPRSARNARQSRGLRRGWRR